MMLRRFTTFGILLLLGKVLCHNLRGNSTALSRTNNGTTPQSLPDRMILPFEVARIDTGNGDAGDMSPELVQERKLFTRHNATQRQKLGQTNGGGGGACIDADWIDRLAWGGRERRRRGPFRSNFGRCHTQGAAYRLMDKRVIVTCQDSDDIARAVSYTSGSGDIQGYSYVRTKTPFAHASPPRYTETYLQHPSSTQIVDDYMPVAFANHQDDQGEYGSKLVMYRVGSHGKLGISGSAMPVTGYGGTGVRQVNPHIGSLGIRMVGNSFVAFGCDYNCKGIYKFMWNPSTVTWSKLGAISAVDADQTTWSNGVSWDAYNSINVVPACTGSAVYLIGTKYDKKRNRIHLWQIISGSGTDDASVLRLKNVAWRHFSSTTRYFREGVAVIPDPPRAHFLTFGEDFKLDGDLYGYELWFFSGSSERWPRSYF